MRKQEAKIEIQSFREATGKNARQFLEEIKLHHYQTLWTYVVNGILALWLISQPFLLDYKSAALTKSDILSGALVILIEILAFVPRLALIRWGIAGVAFWLLMAPLIFWSPTPREVKAPDLKVFPIEFLVTIAKSGPGLIAPRRLIKAIVAILVASIFIPQSR